MKKIKPESNNRSLYLLTGGAFFAFFVFGFSDNLKGPVIPKILSVLKLSYTEGSNILLFSYFGFMIATLIAGFMADRIGNKKVMVLAGFILLSGISGTGFAPHVYMLYVTFFLLGFGIILLWEFLYLFFSCLLSL